MCVLVEGVVSVPEGTERPNRESVFFGRFVVWWWGGGGYMRCDMDLEYSLGCFWGVICGGICCFFGERLEFLCFDFCFGNWVCVSVELCIKCVMFDGV